MYNCTRVVMIIHFSLLPLSLSPSCPTSSSLLPSFPPSLPPSLPSSLPPFPWVWQAENDPSLYGLFVVYDSGAQEPLLEKQCPLMVRLQLGPSEDISKLYIMEKSDARAAQISAEVSYTARVYTCVTSLNNCKPIRSISGWGWNAGPSNYLFNLIHLTVICSSGSHKMKGATTYIYVHCRSTVYKLKPKFFTWIRGKYIDVNATTE